MRYNCKMLLRILHAQVGPIPLLRTKIQRKVKILTKFAFHFSLFVFFFFLYTRECDNYSQTAKCDDQFWEKRGSVNKLAEKSGAAARVPVKISRAFCTCNLHIY